MKEASVALNYSWSANALQTATAVIEAGAGFALLGLPSLTAQLLLGASLETPATLTAARVGGAGLFALGVAAWLARGDTQSRAARGLFSAMVLYNLGVGFILGFAGISWEHVGVFLWPAVVLHVAMGMWCIVSLRKPRIGESARQSSSEAISR
jgi:hypothetical protein